MTAWGGLDAKELGRVGARPGGGPCCRRTKRRRACCACWAGPDHARRAMDFQAAQRGAAAERGPHPALKPVRRMGVLGQAGLACDAERQLAQSKRRHYARTTRARAGGGPGGERRVVRH